MLFNGTTWFGFEQQVLKKGALVIASIPVSPTDQCKLSKSVPPQRVEIVNL